MKLLCVFAVVLVFLLCVVPFLGYGWHLLHGDTISYKGWKILVPKSYMVRNGAEGPVLWRHSFGVPWFHVPYAYVSFFSSAHQFQASTDYTKFEQSMSESAGESGHQLKNRNVMSTGDTTAYCIEFTRYGKEPRALVRCAVQGEKIYAFFEGSPRYIPDLFNILKQMTPKAPRNRPIPL